MAHGAAFNAQVDRSRHFGNQDALRKRFRADGKISIPAIMWLDAALNNNNLTSGVVIGFYNEEHREELTGDIIEIDGLECVLAIPENYQYIFKGKILDFYENSFFCRKVRDRNDG